MPFMFAQMITFANYFHMQSPNARIIKQPSDFSTILKPKFCYSKQTGFVGVGQKKIVTIK